MPTRKYDPSKLDAAISLRRRAMLGVASCSVAGLIGTGYVLQTDYSSVQFLLSGFAVLIFIVGWVIFVCYAVAAGVDIDDQIRYREQESRCRLLPTPVIPTQQGVDTWTSSRK